MVSSCVPTSTQSPWHCLSPLWSPHSSHLSLTSNSPPSLPRPGCSGLPTSAQSSMYHPPTSTQLCHRPPTSSHYLYTYSIHTLWRKRIIDLYQWLTFLRPRSCWLCLCECGAGPQCCLQDWDTQSRVRRERGECDQSRERMVGSGWAALGSLRHIALHYGRKPWARRSFSIFPIKLGVIMGFAG